MTRKKTKRNNRGTSKSSAKGKLVEMIVATMHDSPDVRVERNVRLPAVRSPRRKREIDILISGSMAGYPIRIAIECKNYEAVVDIPYIDAFIGKLQDVGLATQQGIFVSVHGFTSGALERAREAGIVPLLLTGLTKDRLAVEIGKAVQSAIYLLLDITKLEIDKVSLGALLWLLYDQNGIIKGSLPDLVWKKWIEGFPESVLGEYEFEIDIPPNRYHYINNMLHPISSAKVNIKVIGLVVDFQGQVSQHALINPLDNEVNKFNANVSFDMQGGTYPVTTFCNEDGLQKYLHDLPGSVKLNNRIRLPRIRFSSIYWPLSKSSVTKVAALGEICQQEGRLATVEELMQIEGDDIKAIWEPLWDENPILDESKNNIVN